ncbi:unnamed protein product [Musa banksii]
MRCHLQSQGGALSWFIGNPTQEYVMFLTEPFLVHSKRPKRRPLISNEYLSPCSRKAATSPPAKISSSFAIGPYCCLSLLSPRILLLLLFFFAAPLLGSSFGRAEGDFFDPTRVTQLSWRHR